MSRNQKQEHAGQKLGQADQSEIERPPGDLVHLPSHCHRLHFQGGHDKESRGLVDGEVGVGERDAAGRKSGLEGFCHPLLCHKTSHGWSETSATQ